MGVTPKMNWREVKAFVDESYRLIAPKVKVAPMKKAPRRAGRPRPRA